MKIFIYFTDAQPFSGHNVSITETQPTMRRVRAALASLLLAAPVLAADVSPPPVYRAVRATAAPIIDGDLSDPAWQNAPEITGFTQHDPDDGKPATQKTVVKVVYDDNAIYFGAMMYDTRPVTTVLVRRDNNPDSSDWFYI